MTEPSATENRLGEYGIQNAGPIQWNLSPGELVEKALSRREGVLASNGSLDVKTGQFTGRSPNDKFIVRDAQTDPVVHWGKLNRDISEEQFEKMYAKVC